MKEFDKEKIVKEKTVVHCETKQQAKELLQWADAHGLRWCDGERYVGLMFWEVYTTHSGYCLFEGEYSPVEYYEDKGYTVIPFTEALKERPLTPGDKVWVSDESEEHAKRDKDERIFLTNVGGECPFVCVDGATDHLYPDGNYESLCWKFAIPARHPQKTITLDELKKYYSEKEGIPLDSLEVIE